MSYCPGCEDARPASATDVPTTFIFNKVSVMSLQRPYSKEVSFWNLARVLGFFVFLFRYISIICIRVHFCRVGGRLHRPSRLQINEHLLPHGMVTAPNLSELQERSDSALRDRLGLSGCLCRAGVGLIISVWSFQITTF